MLDSTVMDESGTVPKVGPGYYRVLAVGTLAVVPVWLCLAVFSRPFGLDGFALVLARAAFLFMAIQEVFLFRSLRAEARRQVELYGSSGRNGTSVTSSE